MDNKDQVEIDLKLHAFGQHMRKVWEARQGDFEKNIAAFRDGVRADWEHEHAKIQAPKIEEPKIDGPKIEGPKIERPREPDAPEPGT